MPPPGHIFPPLVKMADDRQVDMNEGLGEALRVVENLISRLDSLSAQGDVGGLIFRTDILKRMLVGLNVDDLLLEMVSRAYHCLTNANRRGNSERLNATLRFYSGRRGRPSFDINEEQVHYLLEQGFKVAEISNMLGVGKRTLERRMSSLGLSISGKNLCTSLFNFYHDLLL